MNTALRIFAILGAALTLGACAPTMTGSGTPIQAASPLATLDVPAGRTIFVQYTYPAEYFGISKTDMDVTVPVDFNHRDAVDQVQSPSRAVDWLKLDATDAPNGWNVFLANVAAEKTIARTDNMSTSIEVRYYNNLRVTYKIDVPSTAAGAQPILAQLPVRGKEVKAVPLMLNVKK